MNTWLFIHTATLYQLSCSRTLDNIYIPELYMNFSADEHVVIYTCYNFILSFLQMNTWWYIHTATLNQFSCRWTPDDIYIPQLYINFPADAQLMIYTYRNFRSTFLQINTWWYIDTANLYQFSSRWTLDDKYIPQLYINFWRWTPDDIYILQLCMNFPSDEHLMI